MTSEATGGRASTGFNWQTLGVISVYAFGLSILWNSFGPLLMPYLVGRMEPGLKNSYLGLVTAAGLVVALLVQPLAGGISDRSRSRWGRRRPFIALGTLLDFVFLALVGLAGGFWLLFAGYCLLQASSNIAHGPYQGLLPDVVPENKRGLASGVKNLVELVGLVLCSQVVGKLLGQDNVWAVLLLIAGVLAVSLLITLLFVREAAAGGAGEAAVPPLNLRRVGDALRPFSPFERYVTSRFLILAGLASVRTFAQFYLQDVLEMPNPAAAAGNLMTILGLCVLLTVFPAGYLADRLGAKRLNVLAALIGSIGIVLIAGARSYDMIVVYGAVVGAALGVFLSANWALAMQLSPAGEGALFLGLTNLATAGSGAATALLGPLIDAVNRVAPGQGYQVMFVISAVCWAVGAYILARLKISQTALR